MLKHRLITALVLGLFVLWAVCTWPPLAFISLIMVSVVIGAWEWARLSPLKTPIARFLFVVSVTLCSLAAIFIFPIAPLFILSALGWGGALLLVVTFPKTPINFARQSGWNIVGGFFILVPYAAGFYHLRVEPHGVAIILFLLGLIWSVDTGAYFCGRAFGRTKLAVHLSPGKSWEGVAGGLGCGLLWTVLLSYIAPEIFTNLMGWLFIAAITGFASVLGDLTESLIKRQCGVKDSGHILPGHGGILDRIDSLTAAVPLFALSWVVVLRW